MSRCTSSKWKRIIISWFSHEILIWRSIHTINQTILWILITIIMALKKGRGEKRNIQYVIAKTFQPAFYFHFSLDLLNTSRVESNLTLRSNFYCPVIAPCFNRWCNWKSSLSLSFSRDSRGLQKFISAFCFIDSVTINQVQFSTGWNEAV